MRKKRGRLYVEAVEALYDNPRVTLRKGGVFDPEGQCVVYWMQRSQRALDNPALNLAIQAANLLKRPVVAFLSLIPNAHHANRRHYQFMLKGLQDVAQGLRARGVGFILRRFPDHGLLKFCSEVRPCVVVSDENPSQNPSGERDTGPLLDRGRRRDHSHEALGQRALRRANHSAQDSCAITRIPQACDQSESSSAVENVL